MAWHGCPLFMIAVAPMIAIIAPSLASNYLRKCFRDDGNVNTPIAVCLTSLVRHHCWSLNKDQSVFFISAIEAIGWKAIWSLAIPLGNYPTYRTLMDDSPEDLSNHSNIDSWEKLPILGNEHLLPAVQSHGSTDVNGSSCFRVWLDVPFEIVFCTEQSISANWYSNSYLGASIYEVHKMFWLCVPSPSLCLCLSAHFLMPLIFSVQTSYMGSP